MIDAAFLAAFIALPVAALLLTRSITWLAVAFTFTIALLGTAMQTSVRYGMAWNLRSIQVALLIGFLAMVGFAWYRRKPTQTPLWRQALVVLLPIAILVALMIVMRLTAPGDPGTLSGLGWLVSHPNAEDNAKWLNLASQLASGRDLNFNGYAGGPLLLMMVLVATAVATLSQILLGGFNEVAVAVNTVIGSEFMLIAIVPLAFAPFAEGLIPPGRLLKGITPQRVPAPLVWVGMIVMVSASSVLTFYGHLSLQFVILMLGLWVAVFLVGAPRRRAYLLASLVMVSTAAVWFPLNALAVLVLAGCWAFVGLRAWQAFRGGRQPDWLSMAAVVVITITTWDAIVSSLLYAVGFGQVDTPSASAAIGGAAAGVAAAVRVPLAAFPLFDAGGGTEAPGPVLGMLAAASLIAVGVLYSQSRKGSRQRQFAAFAPIILLIAYTLLIGVGDALITGSAPHYGTHKIGFAVAVVVLAITLPAAFMVLEPRKAGLTLVRALAGLAVLFVLVVDTILPRGLSALSSSLWQGIDPAKPAYWASAEVRPVPEQPVASTPLGCVFLPNGALMPSGQPDGKVTYDCSRLFIGLSGVEGSVGGFMDWIGTDWLSSGMYWNDWYGAIGGAPEDVKTKRIVLLDTDGKVIGFETLQGLLNRFPAVTP